MPWILRPGRGQTALSGVLLSGTTVIQRQYALRVYSAANQIAFHNFQGVCAGLSDVEAIIDDLSAAPSSDAAFLVDLFYMHALWLAAASSLCPLFS